MKTKLGTVSLAALTLFSVTATLPNVALAQKSEGAKQQKQKNDWRNLGAAGAAIAGYGLLKGNATATVLGAAGAAYSAKRYEDARKSQDQAKRDSNRSRYHRSYTDSGRKYYTYQGRSFYKDLSTGERHLVD